MDWQQILVIVIVALAALYLARGYWGKRKKAGCGGCEGCPTTTTAATPPAVKPPIQLVQLELTHRKDPKSP